MCVGFACVQRNISNPPFCALYSLRTAGNQSRRIANDVRRSFVVVGGEKDDWADVAAAALLA